MSAVKRASKAVRSSGSPESPSNEWSLHASKWVAIIVNHLVSPVQPRELREPMELIKDLICNPIAQCVTELAFDMNILPKSNIERRNVSEQMICHFCHFCCSMMYLLHLPPPFLTDFKHHLGLSTHSALQELQFERKRSLLAQCV